MFYVLLSIILIEGFLVFSVAGAYRVMFEEAKSNASTTSAVLAVNKNLVKRIDEVMILNEKVGKANVGMAELMKKYCPAGLLRVVENP